MAHQECSTWAGDMDDGSDWTIALTITAACEEPSVHLPQLTPTLRQNTWKATKEFNDIAGIFSIF
eukprot:1555815-Prorocentrum_lima.AAC.1